MNRRAPSHHLAPDVRCGARCRLANCCLAYTNRLKACLLSICRAARPKPSPTNTKKCLASCSDQTGLDIHRKAHLRGSTVQTHLAPSSQSGPWTSLGHRRQNCGFLNYRVDICASARSARDVATQTFSITGRTAWGARDVRLALISLRASLGRHVRHARRHHRGPSASPSRR